MPVTVLGALLVWACSSNERNHGGATPAPEVSAAPAIEASNAQADESARWDELPLDRLRLSHRGNLGSCPVYEFELRRGGQARWKGKFFTPRIGTWGGEIGIDEYARLCTAVVDLGLERMDASYATNTMHDQTVVIEWERDGRSDSVEDYGRGAPPGFHELRALLEEHGERIDWQPVPEWE